uniref:Coiled-coil domain-containing protein 16 n=1 Tax=Rhabditophanes sp. KR3021 TaxID=114890 RepID=A0AC35UAK0_9BILA
MASAAKINPILAKEVGNDQLLCNICKTTLKKKFWVGHQKGREHKENIIKFKESHANKGVKRHVDDEVVHVEPKKFKVVEEVVEEKMIDGLPAGFFEIAPDSEKKTIESDIIAVKEDDIKKTDDELLQDFYGEIESNEFDQIVLALEEAEANSKVIDDEEAISNVIDNTLQTEQDFETYWNNSKVLEEQKELTQNENMQMSDNEGQEGGESSDDSSVDIDMFRDKTFFK